MSRWNETMKQIIEQQVQWQLADTAIEYQQDGLTPDPL